MISCDDCIILNVNHSTFFEYETGGHTFTGGLGSKPCRRTYDDVRAINKSNRTTYHPLYVLEENPF